MLKSKGFIAVILSLFYLAIMPNWSCKKEDPGNNDTQQIDTSGLYTSQNSWV